MLCAFSSLPRPSLSTHTQPRLLVIANNNNPSTTPTEGGQARFNPQNTDQPVILPSPHFSPAECVSVQLQALRNNDNPWPMHGIQTCYEFAYDVGGLDPSMYFGFRKDLYHLDHFMGMFQTYLSDLLYNKHFEVVETLRVDASVGEGGNANDGRPDEEEWRVGVHVVGKDAATNDGAPSKYVFHLKRKKVGPRKGALSTDQILRAT